MPQAIVVDALRSPIGVLEGALSGYHAADLSAEVLKALVVRNSLDAEEIDEVVLGCVTQIGEQSLNIARNSVLAAGFPETISASTVERQGVSSLAAIQFGAQAVMAGSADVVIAGGVEVMSRIPPGASTLSLLGVPFGPKVLQRYEDNGGLAAIGESVEKVAIENQITREELDEFARHSYERAKKAQGNKKFSDEIIPLHSKSRNGVETDAVISIDENLAKFDGEKLPKMKPIFSKEGVITAGNSAPVGDGAAAALITTEETAARLNLVPKARFHSFGSSATTPLNWLNALVPAAHAALNAGKLDVGEVELFEMSESYATAPLLWTKELKESGQEINLENLNVNGGSIALGEALGASSARAFTTLLHELTKRKAKYSLLASAGVGGVGNALVLEGIY